MAKEKFQDVYFFLASHTQSKIWDGNFVSDKKLFEVQDRGIVTRPEVLYYTKSMPTAILSNVCIPIGLVNKAIY